MTDSEGSSPFREAPRMLACPRDGNILERVMPGVMVCSGCEGVWLGQLALDQAFGTPRWPTGPGAWWRPALACPVCAVEGRGAAMTAVHSAHVFVDRCLEHGVWLDAGELGRIINAPRLYELDAFHERLRPDAVLPPQLAEFRKRRDSYRELRARELEAHLARQRREQEEASARKRQEEERKRAEEEAAQQARRARERAHVLRARLAELATVRDESLREVVAKEKKLRDLRDSVRAAEAALQRMKAELFTHESQLEDARSRAREQQQQIQQLEAELDR